MSTPSGPPFDPTGSSPYPSTPPPPGGSSPYPSSPSPSGGALPPPTQTGSGSGGAGYGGPGYPGAPGLPPGNPYSAQGPRSFEATDAFAYGWQALTRNAAPFLIIGAICAVVSITLSVAGILVDGTLDPILHPESVDPTQPRFNVVSNLLSMLSSLIVFFLTLGMYRMALDVMDGRKAELGRMFSGYSVGKAFIVNIVVGLIVLVGMCLCFIPGLVALFLLYFAPIAVVDEDRSVGDALGASFEHVKANAGQCLLAGLLAFVLGIASLCTLGLASIVLTPLLAIAVAYAWRTMRGRPVAQPV